MTGLGTAVNVAAVLAGGAAGTLLGAKLPEALRQSAMTAIGIITLLIGVANFLEYSNVAVVLVSVVAGLAVGELAGIDAGLRRVGNSLQRWFSKGEGTLSRAFVTTSLLFCVGPLTFLGAIEDGLRADHSLLFLKSALDFTAALSFAAVLGWGVMLSAATVLTVQGGITLGAAFLQNAVTQTMLDAITATGGVLIFALGLGILELRDIRVANMLPALFIAPALVALGPLWPF